MFTRFGKFVDFDLHSYNHRRAGPSGPPADPAGNPEVNVGTGTMRDRAAWAPLIDRFIAENPKIFPSEGKPSEVDIKQSLKLDKKELMTETLARVYLEQGKYKKAIQAYRILSLKYPKKSSFFADQIKAVEKLRADKSE